MDCSVLLLGRDALYASVKPQMIFNSQFVPENIKLRAKADLELDQLKLILQ